MVFPAYFSGLCFGCILGNRTETGLEISFHSKTLIPAALHSVLSMLGKSTLVILAEILLILLPSLALVPSISV